MRYSENLHLNLPEDSDPLEIDKISENFEVLDGAIKEQSKASGYQVGDTLTTYRADLGEEWLLCNGESFDPYEYPELDKLRPVSSCLTEGVRRYIESIKLLNTLNTFSYATDGHYQVICHEASNYNTRLEITDDNFNTVTTKLVNATRNTQIFYVNNKWILVYAAQVGDTSSAWGKVTYISVSDNPLSDWSAKASIPSTIGVVSHPIDIMYYRGKYYLFGMSASTANNNVIRHPVVVEMDDLDWTNAVKRSIPFSSNFPGNNNTIWGFMKTAAGFAICGLYYKNPDSFLCILQSEEPTGPYSETVITLPETTLITGRHVYMNAPILYHNNKYILLGINKNNNKQAYLIWVDADSMELHQMEVQSKHSLSQSTSAYLFPYKNGQYIFNVHNTYEFFVASDLDGSGDFHNLDLSTYLGAASIDYAILVLDGYLQMGGNFKNASGSSIPNLTVQIPIQSVPAISISTGYTYIKAKEGGADNGNQQTDFPAP